VQNAAVAGGEVVSLNDVTRVKCDHRRGCTKKEGCKTQQLLGVSLLA